jgi:hypothetical protein
LLPRSIRPRQLALAFCLVSVILPLAIAAVGRVQDNCVFHIVRRISSVMKRNEAAAVQASLKQIPVGDSRSRPSNGSLGRAQLIRTLSENERPALAFVSYTPDVTVHFEWVYNLSDLASQHVLLAHDLGDEHNRLLIAEFPNRDVWRVRVSSGGAMLIRYDFQSPPAPEGSIASPYERAD